MKKLADISAFERLGVSNTVSDLSVFNGALANAVIKRVEFRQRRYQEMDEEELVTDLGCMLGEEAREEEDRILDMSRSALIDYFGDESKAIVSGLKARDIAFQDDDVRDMYAPGIQTTAIGIFYYQCREKLRERDSRGKKK